MAWREQEHRLLHGQHFSQYIHFTQCSMSDLVLPTIFSFNLLSPHTMFYKYLSSQQQIYRQGNKG